jgi:hypothetical protein
MTIRSNPIYLSSEVWRVLRILAKSRGTVTDDQGLSHTTTSDEMADELLRRVFKAEYPQTLEYLKQEAKREAEEVKRLGGGK